MVFANKYLVGERHTDDISLFVSWFQCIMTVLLVAGFKGLRGWRSENWLSLDQVLLTHICTQYSIGWPGGVVVGVSDS